MKNNTDDTAERINLAIVGALESGIGRSISSAMPSKAEMKALVRDEVKLAIREEVSFAMASGIRDEITAMVAQREEMARNDIDRVIAHVDEKISQQVSSVSAKASRFTDAKMAEMVQGAVVGEVEKMHDKLVERIMTQKFSDARTKFIMPFHELLSRYIREAGEASTLKE